MAGFLTDLFGSRPDVPQWDTVDLGASQQAAIASNAAALPGAEALTQSVNQFTQGEIQRMLESVIPNYREITSGISKNINSLIKGEIPSDVSSAIEQSSAARSLEGGFGGTGLGRNLTARDFGLTSMNLMSQGLSSAQSWISQMDSMFAPNMMSVASMFISPAQQFSADWQNQQAKVEQEWLKSQVDSMPDPVTSGIFKTFTGQNLLQAYGGGNPNQSQTPSGGIGENNMNSNLSSAAYNSTGFAQMAGAQNSYSMANGSFSMPAMGSTYSGMFSGAGADAAAGFY